jgi:Uma2 family endonuclease
MDRLKTHFERVSEVLEKLSYIPPERIRLKPIPGSATEKDVIRAEGRYNCLCELIDGTLVEKPMGYYESRLAVVHTTFLENFLTEHDLGIILAPDAMLRVEPGQVRLPDLCFLSWNQFPGRLLPPGSILDRVPDLAIEILSRSNTKEEMARKRREYFLGGCRLVWEIDPERKAARVYTAPDESKLVREKGTLDGGDVLPGFTLPLAQLFARAGRRAAE